MKPGAIVAIGGGEIGRPGKPIETLAIEQAAIALTGKQRPNVLFVPTASHDSPGYVQAVQEHFGGRLNCTIETLYLYDLERRDPEEKPRRFLGSRTSEVQESDRATMERLIDWADLIYVGGGNTLAMLKRWRKFGVDQLILAANRRGTVLAGVSAGAICWARFALSDSHRLKNPGASYIRVRGLDLVPIAIAPHFDFDPRRRPAFEKMMNHTPGIGIGIDNCAALVIDDDQFRVLRTKPTARLLKTYWHNGEYIEEPLPDQGSISELTTRSVNG